MKFYILPDIENDLKTFCRIVGDDKQRIYLRYLYVINLLLYYKTNFKDLYDISGITINRNHLAVILSVKKGKASVILKNLCAWQIIDKVRGFRQGEYSKAFRLNVRLEQMPISFREVNKEDAPFIRKLIEKKDKERNASLILKQQYELIKEKVTVNAAGIEYLKTKYNDHQLNKLLCDYQQGSNITGNFNSQFANVKMERADIGLLALIIGEIFVVRPDPISRLYTNLTTLKRSHRKYVHLDGKPLLMTDLSNSQILFSVTVIEKHLRTKAKHSTRLPKDFELYKTIALSGTFYEVLANASEYELTKANRNEFKKSFFREIFFSKPKARGQIKQTFKKLFPTVAKTINEIKRSNYTEFAIRLQRMEASIFIDATLVPMLQNEIAALTIHDSIVVNSEKQLNYAEKCITETMVNRYGLVPKFKR